MSGTAAETNFDYEESYGVSNANEDETSVPRSHDGRSKMATGFNNTDVDPEKRTYIRRDGQWRDKWKWLNQVHDGARTEYLVEDNGSANRRADAKRDAQTFGNTLELTPPQRRRACAIIEDLDSLHVGSIPTEASVLAILTLVANQDERMIRTEPTWNELTEVLDVQRSSIRKARQHFREYFE